MMEHLATQLPGKAATYLKDHFPGCVLINCKKIKAIKGNVSFSIDVVKEQDYFHLRFDESGNLVNAESEPAFQEGYHEQYF